MAYISHIAYIGHIPCIPNIHTIHTKHTYHTYNTYIYYITLHTIHCTHTKTIHYIHTVTSHTLHTNTYGHIPIYTYEYIPCHTIPHHTIPATCCRLAVLLFWSGYCLNPKFKREWDAMFACKAISWVMSRWSFRANSGEIPALGANPSFSFRVQARGGQLFSLTRRVS